MKLASILLRASRTGAPPIVRRQDAVDTSVMSPDGRRNLPGREPGGAFVPGAGQFGLGSVTLPGFSGPPDPSPGMDPGPIEPDPLPAPVLPPNRGGPRDVTRGGGDRYPTGDLASILGLGPIAGENWLGGRFLGIDPNTNKPIYDPLGYGSVPDLESLTMTGGTTGNNPNSLATTAAANWDASWGIGSGFGGFGVGPTIEKPKKKT